MRVSVFLKYEQDVGSMKVEVDTGGKHNLSSKSQSDWFCACKFIIRVRDEGACLMEECWEFANKFG